MKIESELKNTRPMPPHQRAIVSILFTASWIDCLLTRGLRPFGLTHPQYNILRILNGSFPKGLSVLDIKSRMIDRSSNVSRLVEKLRRSGLVERITSDQDRRMVIVTISEKAKDMLREIEAKVFGPNMMPGDSLSEAEATELAYLLDKLRDWCSPNSSHTSPTAS
ncbi:MAG TPA: MarR family transcriptional regulator [Saprospiraceae bacterium]|nr:MarR family transcriptional regulator [Saprospiraceae bacterium]HND86758.1 MarR family transcriptional regulator [Saprospiraceae bacterium]HNG90432.1 MarR family transcriptional regulator [Saprospiraceae bacterium]